MLILYTCTPCTVSDPLLMSNERLSLDYAVFLF